MRRRTRHQLTCTVCNMLFPACRSDTLYCSDACAQHACRKRQAARVLPPTSGLEVREWHGTPISRRADGYVNATAMCKAGGREWSTYARSERTKEYIAALQAVPQFCRTELVQSIWGGTPSLQGTWVHPRLAVDLARWISPAFAVWMDGWFLESLTHSPTTHHLPPACKTGKPIKIHAATATEAADQWFSAVSVLVDACHVDDKFSWDRFKMFHGATQGIAERLGFCLLWEHVRD